MKQQYDSYKPSGIDWIGDIPSHWDKCRIKDCFILKTGSTPKGFDKPITDTEVNWFTPSDIDSLGTILHTAERKLSESLVRKESITLFPKGALIFVGIGATAGKLGYAEIEGYSNQQITGLIPKHCCSKYYFYYLCQDSKRVRDNASFTTLPIINNSYLSQVYWLKPPLAEQETIAAWLDEKCQEIDAAIAKVDHEIELIDELKQSEISRVVTRGLNPDATLRPSGIDWIGDVPEHWIIAPFKRSLKINNGCDYKHIVSEEGYPVIGSGGQFAFASDYLYDGEVLLLGRKGTIDRPMYFIGKFWTVDTMFYAIPNDNVCCKYMYYQALGFPYDYYSTATALPSMAASDLANNPIIVPPLSEQQAIADYLDKKCAEIDGLKAKLSKKRETLKELRQSIVSEVVTGKRKVI